MDDVIGMSHRKKCPKGKLQMQKFTKKLSENHFEPLGRFYGTFKKSSEFNSNIKMPMVSLRVWHEFCIEIDFHEYHDDLVRCPWI